MPSPSTSSVPPLPSPSRSFKGTSSTDRPSSLRENSGKIQMPRGVRPKTVSRQNTWGGNDSKKDENDKSQRSSESAASGNRNGHHVAPVVSVAKTINQLLHIPSNRCCADCRSALVDSSQMHASFRPPRLLEDTSKRRDALTRSDFAQTRDFSQTHRAFAPPFPLAEETPGNSSGSMDIFKPMGKSATNGTTDTASSNGSQDRDRHTPYVSGSRSVGRNIDSQEITALNPYAADDSAKTPNAQRSEPPNGSFQQRARQNSEQKAKQQQTLEAQQEEPEKEIIDPALLAYRYVLGHGVFLCAQCANAHRLLGVSVTVVRHVQEYQTWTTEEALAMKNAGGNTMCWKIYEAHLPDHWRRRRPNHASQMGDRLTFCRAKYEAMGFILPPISGAASGDQAWQRLIKQNAWAQMNPGPATELRNLVALNLHRNNALHGYGTTTNNAVKGMPMTAVPMTELPTRLIDYFCVVGSSGFLDPRILQGEHVDLSVLEGPEDLHLEPRVTDCYPSKEHSDMEFPEHVATFVLPEGCRPSDSQKSPFFFTFVLTSASGHRLYGGSLRLYDEAIETQELRDIMDKSDYNGAYPPWLPAQTNSNRSDGGNSVGSSDYMDIVYLPKCLVVLSHYPFFDLFRNFLLQLYRITLVEAPLPIERFIANFTCEVPLPPMGKVEVKFGFTVKDIWSVRRPPENQLPLANFSFKPLFACLSVGNIMTLVGCLLTESRIALCSRHYALLTPIAEALLSFLFPLQWQGMYIPIMPYAMLDILDAPVPFIVGLHARYLIETKPSMRPHGVVFVDVDRDIVHLGYDEDTNSPRMVPALPEKGALKLRAKVEEHGSKVYLKPDNAKLEGNAITNGHGEILPDLQREAYAATYHAISGGSLNERASSSLPGHEEIRRAERYAPRRRSILRSVDKAYQENELLTPITGFLSEQGQLYNREPMPMPQLRAQKSGTSGMGKIFNIRRLRSQSSIQDEEPNNHFSGHFTQSQSNNGIHGLLLDLEEPLGFDSFEIRNAFLRFFVSLLKSYEQFMTDDPNDPFRLEEFLVDLSLSAPSYEFVKTTLKTQMFQRFLEERQNDSSDPLFLFFDECIIAKQNRSKKFHKRTRDTPFLDDPSGAIKETFTPPSPSNWGLPDDGRKYQYGSFPKLNYELFGKIRVARRWKMSRRRSSLRMLLAPSLSASSLLQNPGWQHEMLARTLAPQGGTAGALWAGAKNGIKNLEAAIGALSQTTSLDESVSSIFSTSSSHINSSQRPLSDRSLKGLGSPKKTKNPLRAGFVKDMSLHNIARTSAEFVLLNARRMLGIVLDSICKTQALARGFVQRRRYLRFRKALRFLQCKWRRHVPEGLTEMDALEKARGAVHTLQKVIRAFLLTRIYRKKRASVALIQRWYRGALCRKRFKKLVRACKRIQTLVRSRRTRFGLRLLCILVVKVQSNWRGHLTRKRIKSRNERRMSRYREQIVLLWGRLHMPLSYRTKFWPIISAQCTFLRLRIAESELERLWIVLEVDFNRGSIHDNSMDADHSAELWLGKLLCTTDHTYWRYLKVKEMTGSMLLFPAEERRNPELLISSDRVEAERIQIYERVSANTPQLAAMLVTLYDMFNIDRRGRDKKYRLTEAVWSDHVNASQSERLMTLVFPELEEASNIIFNPPSKRTLKRFRNVNPAPPRLGKSLWAHSILQEQISRNVREVAINALQGSKSTRVCGSSKCALDNYMVRLQRGTAGAGRLSLKAARRDLIHELLADRNWEGN